MLLLPPSFLRCGGALRQMPPLDPLEEIDEGRSSAAEGVTTTSKLPRKGRRKQPTPSPVPAALAQQEPCVPSAASSRRTRGTSAEGQATSSASTKPATTTAPPPAADHQVSVTVGEDDDAADEKAAAADAQQKPRSVGQWVAIIVFVHLLCWAATFAALVNYLLYVPLRFLLPRRLFWWLLDFIHAVAHLPVMVRALAAAARQDVALLLFASNDRRAGGGAPLRSSDGPH